jgi:hypothetical protein
MVGHAIQINITQGTAAAEAHEHYLRVWCHWLIDQLSGQHIRDLARSLMRLHAAETMPMPWEQPQLIGSGPTIELNPIARHLVEQPTTEQRFQVLLDDWRRDTAFTSSATEICEHPAYRQIVSMGADVIPFLLREVDRGTGHLHDALVLITGADPVSDDDAGNEAAIATAWLAWGRTHGYNW